MNHYTRWLALKEENPGQYARDIAGLMNISEAELTFARVGHDAWRLHGDIREIIGALEAWARPNASVVTTMQFTSRWARLRINTLAATPAGTESAGAGSAPVSQPVGERVPHQ